MWTLFVFGIVCHVSKSHVLDGGSTEAALISRSSSDMGMNLRQKQPCSILPPYPPAMDDMMRLSLWALLDKSRREIQISATYKDVVLVLGNTGSGKTTVTQLLAGNASSLQVQSTPEKKLVIVDPDRKIGMTTISRTLVPELVVDKLSGLALYDCPGFQDNRGPKVDITANFLLKKITDHVSNAKLVFVSIYSSVYGTEDKSGFDNLATSAVRLIRNFDKMDKGIGLVVTKVPNIDPTDGHRYSDEETMITIKAFLEMYKSVQENRLNNIRPGEDRRTIMKKIDFVRILLKENRIWFMRTPLECGPVTSTSGYLHTKEKLTQLILNNLSFVPCTPQDFWYALSDSSIMSVRENLIAINQNISDIAATLVRKLRKGQYEKILQIRELGQVKNFISLEYEAWSTTLTRLANNYNATRFMNKITQTLESRQYENRYVQEFARGITEQVEYLGFFETIAPSDMDQIRDSDGWMEPFTSWMEDDITKHRDWYDFLVRLRTYLNSWDFQRIKPSVDINPTIPVDLNFVKREVLRESGPGGLIDDRILTIYTSSLLQSQEKLILNDILNQGLERSEVKCAANKMLVTGINVRVSEFTNPNGTYSRCPDADIVQIFASRKLYIDASVQPKPRAVAPPQIFIVAPIWEVVSGNNVVFNLNGADGNPPPSAPPTGGIGSRGSDGDAGTPGNPGGFFYGISAQILHPERLRIMANGGRGGDGQKGGDGGFGEKGADDDYGLWPSCLTPGLGGDVAMNGHRYFDVTKNGGQYGFEYFCTKYGRNGSEGANGGNGGVGGLAGYPGTIETMLLNDIQAQITAETKPGVSGLNAIGGKGGLGGERGDGTEATLWDAIGCGYKDIRVYPNKPGTNRANSGQDGVTGMSRTTPKPPPTASISLVKHTLINSYKTFLISKSSPVLPNSFMETLEDSEQVKELYGPIPFAEELLNLEEFALTLKNKKDVRVTKDFAAQLLIPRYRSILDRLDAYAKTAQAQISSSQRMILAVLYTTALSQLNCLKQALGSTVVVDFGLYLDTVLDNFKTFKDKQRQFVTREERNQYDAKFNTKIEEALKFIDETVNPAIDEVEKQVNSISNDLLTTVVHLEKEGKDNIETAKIRVQRMKETMVMRHVFSGLKIGASIVSMIGPQGAAIGGVIGGATAITEQFVVGANTPKTRPHQQPLPASVGKYAANMEAKMKSWNEGKIKELDVLLETTKKAIGDNKIAMDDVKKNVDELQKSVDEYKADPKGKDILTYLERKKKIEEHEKDLKDVLEKKKVELEGLQKGTEEQKQKAKTYGDKALKAIGYIKSAITNFAELGYELYNTYKNDEAKMNELADDVQKAMKDVENLQKYKASISETLEPMVASIGTDLQNITGNLQDKSAVGLQVQKWEVKQRLTEFKDFLQDFSEGYPEAKRFSQAVDKLSEAVTLIIDLYDYIERYHDQMEFANYMANINSPDALNIVIGDDDGGFISKIQVALQASILLSQWERAVQTFKQWVFPYAKLYESDFNTEELPNYLDPTSSINTPKDIELFLVDFLVGKVDKLRRRIKDYESTAVAAIDDTLKETVFNSDGVSTLPFYAWKAADRDEEDRILIRKLFSGEKVFISVSPDYAYSNGRSAVKFKLAEFQPKSADPAKRWQLKSILDGLKVEMKHSGVSRYTFDDTSFEMVGDSATLQYNFERNPATGERIDVNNVYRKVAHGDYILSPYTMWTVQFSPAVKGVNRLSELAEMADYVNLELVGNGTYVDERDRMNDKMAAVSFFAAPMPLHFSKFRVSSANMPATLYWNPQ